MWAIHLEDSVAGARPDRGETVRPIPDNFSALPVTRNA